MQTYISLVLELDFQYNLLSRHKVSLSYGALNGDNFILPKSLLLPVSFIVRLSLLLTMGNRESSWHRLWLGRPGTSAHWGSLLAHKKWFSRNLWQA